MSIELRWGTRQITDPSDAGASLPIGVLQYRFQAPVLVAPYTNGPVMEGEWSEWRDVKIKGEL